MRPFLLQHVRRLGRWRFAAVALVGMVSVYLIAYAIRTQYYIEIGTNLAAQAVPFSRSVPTSTFRILVAGDSTAVGTGASASSTSVAGLLGQRYPEADITNVAVNGAKMRDVAEQLQQAKGVYDIILLQAGGNDTVRFTSITQLEQDTNHVLRLATIHGKHVMFGSSANVGSSLLFPPPTRWIFERRTRETRAIFLKATATAAGDVHYIDLFREHNEDPFTLDAERYYASDWFHPSDTAYAHWYRLLAYELDQIAF